MLRVSTAEGWCSVHDDDVLRVYRGDGDGRYTHCTIILHGGTEVSGAISNDALACLEARLADDAPSPMTARRRRRTVRSTWAGTARLPSLAL